MKSLLFCLWVVTTSAWAWDRHDLITEHALKKVVLPDATVKYVPLAEALAGGMSVVKSNTVDGLLRELKLNKTYAFLPKLNEAPGRVVFVPSILSKYADEPDWGPDQELFAADQYPELWTGDMPYISVKTGSGSGGFRHMFFPGKIDWSEPLSSFQIPLRPIGEAPARAELYYKLSQDFFRRGQPYWGYRFLAWSLHLVEDLYQPFHVRQCPSKAFMRWKLKWGVIPTLDIPRTAAQIEYYHLAYEQWLTDKAFSELKEELLSSELSPKFPQGIEAMVLTSVVPFASRRAQAIGTLSERFFPEYNFAAGASPKDKIGTKDWWDAIKESKSADAAKLKQFTHALFREMGMTVRRMVSEVKE